MWGVRELWGPSQVLRKARPRSFASPHLSESPNLSFLGRRSSWSRQPLAADTARGLPQNAIVTDSTRHSCLVLLHGVRVLRRGLSPWDRPAAQPS